MKELFETRGYNKVEKDFAIDFETALKRINENEDLKLIINGLLQIEDDYIEMND